MKTIEELRQTYVAMREAAKTGSPLKVQAVVSGMTVFDEHFRELYAAKDSVVDRAKCRNSIESINSLLNIVKTDGLQDFRVRAFFGLAEAKEGAPSFAQVMRGDDVGRVLQTPPKKADGEKNEGGGKPTKESKAKSKGDGASPLMQKPMPAVPKLDEVLPSGGSFDPQSLSEFIGQEHVVKRIAMEIQAARIQGKKHIDHILLLGNHGLGKSTLMKLIAKELGVGYEFLDASQFGNDVRSQRTVQKFLQRISQANAPVVIAIDEIHALPKHIQTALLTLLNDRVYSYIDEASVTHNLPIDNFTFIGATTDGQDLLPTLKDRCNNLTFYLKDYTREELTQIFYHKFTALGLNVDGGILADCVNRCRSSIREVDSIVKGLHSRAIVSGTDVVNAGMLEEYFVDIDRDPIGLKAKDLEILNAIKSDMSGVMSEDTLAARVHLDPRVLTKEFEPYLIKIGFISITSRGRSLTDKALAYLKEQEPSDEPSAEPESESAEDDFIDDMFDDQGGTE